jgi:hypothetical protein
MHSIPQTAPSSSCSYNLQRLYEVRYKGTTLDGDATIKLLEAINDIKNNPLPERYKASE